MARWVLGGLLLAMAGGQLADAAAFVDIIATYALGGEAPATVIGALLITGEIAGGAGLMVRGPGRRRAPAAIAVAVAAAWTALTLQAFARGLALDNCGCFGVYLGQSLRWWVLIEDVEFVALALWVLHTQRRPVIEPSPSGRRVLEHATVVNGGTP